MTTTDTIKGKINESEEMARKIWLAGLGAYGKSVEEAQGRYEKLSEEANKMFDELVTKGETLKKTQKVSSNLRLTMLKIALQTCARSLALIQSQLISASKSFQQKSMP